MKQLVEFLVKSLVENPDQVVLTERSQEGEVILELKVASDDLGRVIGKGGSTINAIRTVVQAAASSHNIRSKLDVVE